MHESPWDGGEDAKRFEHARIGYTVWFTGLPSSGKSTLARRLEAALKERGSAVEVLDGDEVRQRLSRGLGFSKADRDENIRRIAYVANLITRSGGVAITCAISPYRDVREEARREIGRFIEVYLNCPLDVCVARDVKGLYAKALRGEIQAFTGISDPYEQPASPELTLATDRERPEESVARILGRLEELGYLPPGGGGLRPVPLPRYLLDRLEEQLPGTPFRDVTGYVTSLIMRAIEEPREFAVPTEEVAAVTERLRQLGYLD